MTATSSPTTRPRSDLLDLQRYRAELDAWLGAEPDVLVAARRAEPVYERKVETMRALMAELHAAGWSQVGWPVEVGGAGGSVLHRAVMWEALARHGVHGMALFEHLEVLAPVLAAHGPQDLIAELLPEYLAGRQLWAQGFSEPDSGSDLPSLRTTAVLDGDHYVVNGSKIWTSWARYATWCLLLARTGPPDSRHRGLTALVVDLRTPGVEVRAIEQANGTDELAEVHFSDVRVPADRIVGEVGGGWQVAMHILSCERGTFAWFRHCFQYQQLLECARDADGRDDSALGDAFLDLVAVTSTGLDGISAHATGATLGPRAAFNKLLLCAAEQSVHDHVLDSDTDLAVGVQSPEVALRRQEFLFSRIVTVYGGSQQMQLDTIAKHFLGLP